jgi:peroxiredoxin
MRDMLGTRLVLFFFNPEVDNAKTVGIAVQEAADVASDHNFRVIGVGTGSSASTLSRFAEEQGYTFPVLDDSSGLIAKKLRLQIPVAILGIDADGYVGFGLASFAPGDEATASARDQLRPALRIGDPTETGDGELLSFPEAPQLNVVSLGSGDTVSIESLRGKAAIVIFFLHTCPHCHHALEAIEKIMKGLPDEQKPELVAISVQNSPAAIRKALADLNLDFFTPYLDPGGKAAERWGVTGGVPVVTVIDAEGRIRHRSQGWSERRDGGMLRMRVAAATGANVPMLLNAKGFTGNDACGVCHEQEYATWQYTKHATAFDTLVTHGADRRKDCVGCHVVGYEEKGGYDFATRPAHLEDVGCESCHGRGGPHLSPTFVPVVESGEDKGKKDYAQVCSTCHNPTHSLGFEFDTFHPLVSHATIAGMSNEERAGLLEGGPSRDLLPTSADHVGSLACQSCHTKEFETWKASPHAHAVATLEAKGEATNTECLQCHTTAYGKPGGFPEGAKVADHGDLASVGCESCHGPGGDHIGENAKRVGTILSLGDKCDSCAILKVCGSCHDDANDPGFQFEVEQRIDDQRHGTIESAATRAGESAFHMHDPEDTDASRSLARAAGRAHDRALLRHALDHAPVHGAERGHSKTSDAPGGRG